MSRQFDGDSDRILTTVATAVQSYTFGTWVILFKRNSVNWNGMMNLHNAAESTAGAGLELGPLSSDDSRMFLSHGGSSSKTPTAFNNSDGWVLLVIGKNTGSAVPTYSRYDVDDATWTHGNCETSLSNAIVGVNAQRMVFGRWQGSDDYAGLLAAAAIWQGTNLNNTQRETLWPNMSAWLALNPDNAWQFNQAATTDPVLDLMANGGDQVTAVGTTVSVDEPAGFTYFGGAPPEPDYVRPTILVTQRPHPKKTTYTPFISRSSFEDAAPPVDNSGPITQPIVIQAKPQWRKHNQAYISWAPDIPLVGDLAPEVRIHTQWTPRKKKNSVVIVRNSLEFIPPPEEDFVRNAAFMMFM